MATITVRLKKSTCSLLRREAANGDCDQKDILQAAIPAFYRRQREILPAAASSPIPTSFTEPRDVLLFSTGKRRRAIDTPLKKFTTTLSEETHHLIHQLTKDQSGKDDLVDRAICFYLWEAANQGGFRDFLYPKLVDSHWRKFLES